MKSWTIIVAALGALAAPALLLARQPAPPPGASQGLLPAPQSIGDESGLEVAPDDNFYLPPPVPPLPYGFTWDSYQGAVVEHDVYGYRRLHPPPKKTVSCHGWFAAFTDSVHVLFSYPTPYRPSPVYCCSGHGRCVPAKISYGARSHYRSDDAYPAYTAPAYTAPAIDDPALYAPQPLPEPGNWPELQPRLIPVRPLVPPVLVDDSGLPARPLPDLQPPQQPEIAPQTPATSAAPMPPPPVLTEDPPAELPRNTVPQPSTLPRNKIPARASSR